MKSLTWHGERLVDWAEGGASWDLDGHHESCTFIMGYRFDAAIESDNGRFVFVYERLGTKGVLLFDGRVRREIDRSYYCAEAYDFPIALFRRDERLLLVRCSEYCRLEIEDALSGESVLGPGKRAPSDFFHSQLTVNPSGSRFASAGWIWHPLEVVVLFDIDSAVRDGRALDEGHEIPGVDFDDAEQSSAVWLDDDRLLVATTGKTCQLGIHDVVAERVSTVDLDAPLGRMMPLGSKHVIGFHKQPRIVSLETGRTVHVFEELDGGDQVGAIALARRRATLATDPRHDRFAIADANGITVVEIDVSRL